MSILSFSYVLFAAAASLISWLIPSKEGSVRRTITICALNLVFLSFLRARILDVAYIIVLCIWTWFAGLTVARNRTPLSLALSVSMPAAGLFFFKYAGLFSSHGILLPLGISFYTFKAISYLADIYQNRIEKHSLLPVFAYLTFFPVFMAGPINRAEPFFNQLNSAWMFSYSDQKKGFLQAMLGGFEKLVIADQLARGVRVFLSAELSGWYTVFGVLLYSFQIYADFDAYSNVAIGVSRLIGVKIEKNFDVPYLSASIISFWRRWHISLSSWLRDYVYIPLGGSRKGEARRIVNVMTSFLISGLWHGSTILFVIWGAGHGVLNLLEGAVGRAMKKRRKKVPVWLLPAGVVLNFVLVSLLWVFFRSASLAEAMGIFARMSTASGLPRLSFEAAGITLNELNWLAVLMGMIILSDLFRWALKEPLDWLGKQFFVFRWAFYAALLVIAVIFGVYGPGYHPEDFIYVTF